MSLPKTSRKIFLEALENEEVKRDPDIPITRYMGSKAGRIMELAQDYQAITDRDWVPMENIYELIEILYEDGTGWEDIKRMAQKELTICSSICHKDK